MQEVLPDAGSTRYKDMLAESRILALHLVLVRLVFQPNDLGMITFLPLSLGILNVYKCKNVLGW